MKVPELTRVPSRDHYADHPVGNDGHYKPSSKLHDQSAGAKRAGDNTYPDYPDTTTSNGFESTGTTGAGSKKGTR